MPNFTVFLLLFIFLLSPQAWGVAGNDLKTQWFKTQVTIEITPNLPKEKWLGQAFAQGMQQTLRILLARKDIPDILQKESQQAQDYIVAYSLENRPSDNEFSQKIAVKITFQAQKLLKLLQRFKIHPWLQDRPSFLFWISLKDIQGQSQLAFQNTHPKLSQVLAQYFDPIGIAAMLPVGDLKDLIHIKPIDVEEYFTKNIQKASQPYGDKDIILMRAKQTPNGKVLGQWRSFHTPWSRQYLANSLTELVRKSLDEIWPFYYQAWLNSAYLAQTLRIWIEAIPSEKVVEQLKQQLEKLTLAKVHILKIQGKNLYLEVPIEEKKSKYLQAIKKFPHIDWRPDASGQSDIKLQWKP